MILDEIQTSLQETFLRLIFLIFQKSGGTQVYILLVSAYLVGDETVQDTDPYECRRRFGQKRFKEPKHIFLPRVKVLIEMLASRPEKGKAIECDLINKLLLLLVTLQCLSS